MYGWSQYPSDGISHPLSIWRQSSAAAFGAAAPDAAITSANVRIVSEKYICLTNCLPIAVSVAKMFIENYSLAP
jgi:hypothetical protein